MQSRTADIVKLQKSTDSNSQAEIGKDIEKTSCVEADDSELFHVSK